jgi:CUB/sushi domain-containing protein
MKAVAIIIVNLIIGVIAPGVYVRPLYGNQQGYRYGYRIGYIYGRSCSRLGNPANGVVDVTGNRPGNTATYSCNTGFTLVGTRTRNCLRNGEWSNTAPVCRRVDCGPLSIANGRVAIAPDSGVGGIATYVCNLGFILSGTNQRTCQANGEWSNTAPVCQRISCGNLPDPDTNGRIVSSDGTFVGDRTTYGCNGGFVLIGTPTIICQNDGAYSDDAPTCNAIDCGSLFAPDNGNVFFFPGTTFMSTATFSCRRGFQLVGNKVRTCQADGSWTGIQPVCKKVQCPKLNPPHYGKLYTSGYRPGDYAVFDCIYGYELIGKRRIVCLRSGKWSGSSAECKRSSYNYDHSHEYSHDSNNYYNDNYSR